MMKIKAIIVDDEASNRRLIDKLVSNLNSGFEIVGEAKDINAAYDLINLVEPDLVFLDIKMPGGNGFALLEMFAEINFEVVFISGFDSYALKAFEFNALDYVLKPIDPNKFSITLDKVRSNIIKKNFSKKELKGIINTYDLKKLVISKISIHSGNNVLLLNVEDIIHITSDEGCTIFKMKNGAKYNSAKEFADFAFILEAHPFWLKINKGTYINIDFIESYSKGTTCFLKMIDGQVMEISRRKKSEVLELLSGRKIKDF